MSLPRGLICRSDVGSLSSFGTAGNGRRSSLRFNGEEEAKPFDTSVLYVVAFSIGKEPEEFATPRSIGTER